MPTVGHDPVGTARPAGRERRDQVDREHSRADRHRAPIRRDRDRVDPAHVAHEPLVRWSSRRSCGRRSGRRTEAASRRRSARRRRRRPRRGRARSPAGGRRRSARSRSRSRVVVRSSRAEAAGPRSCAARSASVIRAAPLAPRRSRSPTRIDPCEQAGQAAGHRQRGRALRGTGAGSPPHPATARPGVYRLDYDRGRADRRAAALDGARHAGAARPGREPGARRRGLGRRRHRLPGGVLDRARGAARADPGDPAARRTGRSA